jgi:serpin B
MILANALYFKASWENQFDPKATQEETFHGRSGDAEVKMMYRKGAYEYMEYQGCQMIKLPYLDSEYAMYVVLPPAGMDPETVLPYIGESVYNMAMGMLKPEQVRFSMPKVRLETSMNLNKTLGKMGVKTAFSGAADFKEISVSGPLVLDEVAQNCYIDITESGTEAAAVTSAAISLTSLRPQENVKTMKVDRPYIFFIADSENILFTGKILNL